MADLVVQLLLPGSYSNGLVNSTLLSVPAAHGVKLPVSWEKDSNEAGPGTWQVGPAAQLQEDGVAVGVGVGLAAAAYEIEFADAGVPVALLAYWLICQKLMPSEGSTSVLV